MWINLAYQYYLWSFLQSSNYISNHRITNMYRHKLRHTNSTMDAERIRKAVRLILAFADDVAHPHIVGCFHPHPPTLTKLEEGI